MTRGVQHLLRFIYVCVCIYVSGFSMALYSHVSASLFFFSTRVSLYLPLFLIPILSHSSFPYFPPFPPFPSLTIPTSSLGFSQFSSGGGRIDCDSSLLTFLSLPRPTRPAFVRVFVRICVYAYTMARDSVIDIGASSSTRDIIKYRNVFNDTEWYGIKSDILALSSRDLSFSSMKSTP